MAPRRLLPRSIMPPGGPQCHPDRRPGLAGRKEARPALGDGSRLYCQTEKRVSPRALLLAATQQGQARDQQHRPRKRAAEHAHLVKTSFGNQPGPLCLSNQQVQEATWIPSGGPRRSTAPPFGPPLENQRIPVTLKGHRQNEDPLRGQHPADGVRLSAPNGESSRCPSDTIPTI